MALIPDLSDIPELTLVADGEYDLRVIVAKEIPSKKTGRNSIMLVCEILEEDNALNLIHSIWLPMETDDEDKKATMWRMIKEFLTAIGLDTADELEPEDFLHVEFSALLGTESSDDYADKNVIKRIT